MPLTPAEAWSPVIEDAIAESRRNGSAVNFEAMPQRLSRDLCKVLRRMADRETQVGSWLWKYHGTGWQINVHVSPV